MRTSRLALFACLSWLALVLGFYYRRAWSLAWIAVRDWATTGRLSAAIDPGGVRQAAAAPLLVASLVIAGFTMARLLGAGRGRTGARASVGQIAVILLPVGVAALLWPRSLHQPLLPSATEASLRALGSIAAASLVVFDALVVGRALLRLLAWTGDSRTEQWLFCLAVGFGGIAYLAFALALFGWYRPHIVGAASIAIAAAGLAVRLSGRWRRMGPARVSGGPSHIPAGYSRFRLMAPDRVWAIIAATAVAVALVGALAPETEYDALWYHLWLPALWMQHGRPVDVVTEYVSLYPMTWELVFGYGLVMAGPVAAKLLHFACLPLVAVATWQFTRRFFPDGSPWLAAAIFVTVPTVTWEATTAYVDLALALYITLGLYALVAHMEPTLDSSQTRAWFAVAALCLGLAAAVKHLGLIALAAAACVLFIARLSRRDSLRTSVAMPALLVGTALLVATPWYTRSSLASGNPFFPEMFKLFGAVPAARWDAVTEHGLDAFKARFGLPRTPLNLAMLPWNVTMHGALFGGCAGPFFLLALPLVLLRGLRTAPGRWLVFISLAYVAVWALPVSSFQARFLVPIVPVLSVLAAPAAGRLITTMARTAGTRLAAGVIALVLLANLPPFIPLHEGDRNGWGGWMTHVIRVVPFGVVAGRESADAYLRQRLPTYAAWQFAGTHLPSGARVLEFGGGDNLYATRERLSMDATLARGAWTYGPDGGARARRALADLAVSDVLFDKTEMADLQHQGVAIALPGFTQHALAVEYEDQHAILYRVNGQAGAGGLTRASCACPSSAGRTSAPRAR